MANVEELIEQAKLAEQAERYEDMAKVCEALVCARRDRLVLYSSFRELLGVRVLVQHCDPWGVVTLSLSDGPAVGREREGWTAGPCSRIWGGVHAEV